MQLKAFFLLTLVSKVFEIAVDVCCILVHLADPILLFILL